MYKINMYKYKMIRFFTVAQYPPLSFFCHTLTFNAKASLR